MTPAENYHAAVRRLSKAELAHRKTLDALSQAIADRASSQTGYLRRDCEKTETALAEALTAACLAHRGYWQGRRDALRDELHQASLVIAEYDALARLAGDASATPALSYLQALATEGRTAANLIDQDVLATDGVPQEAPDCALLEDERGVWRP